METVVTFTLNPAVDLFTETDHVEPEHKLRCTTPRLDPGGGGINVSRALKKLGCESTAVYSAGGPPGDMLAHMLEREGLTHRALRVGEWTRQSFSVGSQHPEALYRFVLPGPRLQEREWQEALALLAALPKRPTLIVGSGSLPPGAPEDFYARLVQAGADLGARTVIDASGAALRAVVDAGPALLKPNRRELEALTGEKVVDAGCAVRLARTLVARGVSAVLVSLGSDGAVIVTADEAVRLTAPDVPISSTVGAGDSMVAGVVLGLAHGDAYVDAARRGIAAGTAAVMTPGTELCRREDFDRLLPQIRAEPLAP
ncbi:MAG: 1-phosphofructokinase family hexose kinase [Myxococcales bacterium]